MHGMRSINIRSINEWIEEILLFDDEANQRKYTAGWSWCPDGSLNPQLCTRLSPAQKVPPAPDTAPSLWCVTAAASGPQLLRLLLGLTDVGADGLYGLQGTLDHGWLGCSPGVLLLYLKLITNKDLLYSTGNSAQCDVASWVGGQSGGE